MRIENPAALRFIIDEDLYLLAKDKNFTPAVMPEIIEPEAEISPVTVKPATVIIPEIPKQPAISFKYLGGHKKNFLILVHYADKEFIDDTHLTALQNILKRMELLLDDVAILNIATHANAGFDEILGFFKPRRLLLMGKKALPKNTAELPLNQPKQLENYLALYSFSFDEMMSSNDNKKAFWDQMKTL